MSSTVARIHAISNRVHLNLTANERKGLEQECEALATFLRREHDIWRRCRLASGCIDAGSPTRLLALLSLVIHNSHPARTLTGSETSGGSSLSVLANVALEWVGDLLGETPGVDRPGESQLVIASALLRAKVFQGWGRQLSIAIDALSRAALTDNLERGLLWSGNAVHVLHNATFLTSVLADLSRHCELELLEGGPVELLLPALDTSSVLELTSRAVLVLAGWLRTSGERMEKRVQDVGRRLQLMHVYAEKRKALREVCRLFSSAFHDLSGLTGSPELFGGSTGAGPTSAPSSPASPADPSSGPPIHRLDPIHAAPLWATDRRLDPTHILRLRRLLSGPCARHLVLCLGLRSLCELDGGSMYGVPETAGLEELLPLTVHRSTTSQQQAQRQGVWLREPDPLANLLTLLAMAPDDPEAEPPGRAMRLRLTIRVARAAVASAHVPRDGNGGSSAGGGSGGPGGSGSGPPSGSARALLQSDSTKIAVQALQFAVRHWPPPQGRGGGRRRRAALRQWAAAAEAVACGGLVLVVGSEWRDSSPYRLGLLLGMHPSLMGALSRQDLDALASDGHLHRGAEALVRILAAEERKGARPTSSTHQPAPDDGPTDPEAAASAVRALVTGGYRRGSLWARPMTHLLLLWASERAAYERQGTAEGGERAGGGAGAARVGALRTAASLAVALGKLLWACEAGQVAVVTRGWNAMCVEEDEPAKAVWGTVCVAGEACCLGTEGDGGLGGAGEQGRGSGGGQGVAEGGGGGDGGRGVEGAGEDEDMWGRVWVCAYGAWRWLPALASLARRTAAVGYGRLRDLEEALAVWRPLLVWVQRLCLAQLREAGVVGGEGPAGQEEGAGAAGASGSGGDGALGAAAGSGAGPGAGGSSSIADTTSGRSSGGGDGGGSGRMGAGGGCGCGSGDGQGCGCWRDCLLHELDAVQLLGAALGRLVPRMVELSVREERRATTIVEAMGDIASACVLLAAAYPDEVARAAPVPPGAASGDGGQGTCGNGGSSSSRTVGGPRDAAPWSYEMLGCLMPGLRARERGRSHPLLPALLALMQWLVEGCQPVAFCTAVRVSLMRAAEALWRESDFKTGVGRLPPLCELRALLRTCSNPRCVVLPPHGEAVEQAEGRGRLEACPGGCGGAWYCCRGCRKEHWVAGHRGQCCGAGGAADSQR